MPFEKGKVANPNGRPKQAKIWSDAIMRAIKRREQDDPCALEKLADKLLRKVEEGDVPAIKELGDRIEGKVAQVIAGDPEQPLIPRAIEIINVGTSKTRDT